MERWQVLGLRKHEEVWLTRIEVKTHLSYFLLL